MSNDEIRDLLPAYALDALDRNEHQQVEEALQVDSALRADMEAYRDVTDALALLAPPVEPAADLRDRLMIVRPWRLLLAVAAALIVLLAAIVLVINDDEAHSPAVNLAATIEADPAAVVVVLLPTVGHENVQGEFVIAASQGRALLRVENLPRLDEDHRYQMWLVEQDDGRRSAALFYPGDETTEVVIDLPTDFATAIKAVGVTIEPAGGSPGPTSPPIFTAPVP